METDVCIYQEGGGKEDEETVGERQTQTDSSDSQILRQEDRHGDESSER